MSAWYDLLTSVENIVRNQKSLEFSRLASNWNESHCGSWARAKELNGLVIFPFTTMNICMIATENLDLYNRKPYLVVTPHYKKNKTKKTNEYQKDSSCCNHYWNNYFNSGWEWISNLTSHRNHYWNNDHYWNNYFSRVENAFQT